MQRGFIILKRFITLTLFIGILAPAIFGQRKPVQAKPRAPKCSGAWTGTVKYSRTQTSTENKTTPRASMMGEDSTLREMKYEYKGRVLVSESPDADGSTRARAVIDSRMTSSETTSAKEKVSCDKGKTWQTQTGKFKSETKVTGTSGDADASVTVGFNDNGTYNVAVSFPQIKGETEGSFSSTFSGQCKEKKGVDEKMAPAETSISGNSLISDGSHRFDGTSPNRLSGSYTQTGVAGMEETISWTLQRCGSPLMITEVELFQPIRPDFNNWIKIQNGNYTIDGNMVKVVAKIANLSGETKTAPIEFRELKENALLPEGKMPISVDANEEKEIVYMWDTSGYAWKESGELNQPEINRQIEVKITGDSKTESVEVRPKPVIVIPGMWTDKDSLSEFMKYFENMNSTHWAVDYARVLPSKRAVDNVQEVATRIKEMQERTNAWHVDLVGHSTGGLTGRAYIHYLSGMLADGKPTVTNFIMVGTPNKGTPCSIGVDNILTRFFSKSGDAFSEITLKNMEKFNRIINARNGTKFYALVGHGYNKTCQLTTPGDGIVPAGSALWESSDFVKTHKYTPKPSTHEFILGESPNIKVIHQWLAIGPKGNHLPDADFKGTLGDEMSDEIYPERRNYGARFHQASFETDVQTTDDEDTEPSFLTGAKLKPNQSTEIEIPVTVGKRMAINLLAPKNVSFTLRDSDGTVVGQNLSGTPEAAQVFRSINVDKPFQKGTWRLKLDSKETEESEIAVVVFIF